MLGAIAGDIIGSVYEFNNVRHTDFPLFGPAADFTDDTVLTLAVAEAILEHRAFNRSLQAWYMTFPHCSYGGSFHTWARSGGSAPYGSWGNGSAMRVSPAGWVSQEEETVLQVARDSAAATHNHPEGIKGAQAVSLAILLARQGHGVRAIEREIAERFDYFLAHDLDELREHYAFDVSCQGSVPQAISCALQGRDFEDTVRKAVSIGGDSDTIAAIAGSIAEARFGGIPDMILYEVWARLTNPMRRVVTRFHQRFELPGQLPKLYPPRDDLIAGR